MSNRTDPQPNRLPGPEPGQASLANSVATTVARVRTNLGMDVDRLAEWSGLTRVRLEALEAGTAVPNLRELWTLARVFELPFGLLLSGCRIVATNFRVLRRDAGRVIVSADGRLRSRAVTATEDPREPEVYEMTLAPGCVEEAAAHAPDTFEHLLVVSGTLIVRAGDDDETLGPGDALFFRADRPHVYENPGDDVTVVHLTMSYAGDWTGFSPAD